MNDQIIGETIARLARALWQIEWAIKNRGWIAKEAEAERGDSWYGHVEVQIEGDTRRARDSAREIIRALAQGALLPDTVDRALLIEACKVIRQEDQFDEVAVRKTLDHAALVFTDEKRLKLSRPTPPCPKGFGQNTHESLYRAVPFDVWFGTGELKREPGVVVADRTIRKWCKAMAQSDLEHNNEEGSKSRYRLRP